MWRDTRGMKVWVGYQGHESVGGIPGAWVNGGSTNDSLKVAKWDTGGIPGARKCGWDTRGMKVWMGYQGRERERHDKRLSPHFQGYQGHEVVEGYQGHESVDGIPGA